MIWYTSDLHLGHANVIRHCGRPFADADEMDTALIKNWNARVHRNDTVYIVGDFLFRAKKPAEEYLSALKGKKHLVTLNIEHSTAVDTEPCVIVIFSSTIRALQHFYPSNTIPVLP